MMTEVYVSFETAKLLKEKGFDVYGDGSFNSGIEVFAEYSPSGTFNKCTASKPQMMLQDALDDVFYDTYEEACKAAIKYYLENLI